MSPSATPATQSDGGLRQEPHLPRKVPRRQRSPSAAQARHQSQPSAISATPATQSAAASTAPKRCPSAPPEPARCHKCHACHAKRRWMSPSATPATQRQPHPRHQSQPSAISATPAARNEGGCRQGPRLPRKVTADVAKVNLCRN